MVDIKGKQADHKEFSSYYTLEIIMLSLNWAGNEKERPSKKHRNLCKLRLDVESFITVYRQYLLSK